MYAFFQRSSVKKKKIYWLLRNLPYYFVASKLFDANPIFQLISPLSFSEWQIFIMVLLLEQYIELIWENETWNYNGLFITLNWVSQCLRNMKNVYTWTMLSHNILELINHNTNIYLKCSIFNRIENSNPKFKLNSGKI